MKKRSALVALVLTLAVMLAPSSGARTADCHPVRAVFYTSSDWLRLAQGLSADASSCADYYVTVPALAADKTQMVNNRASAVRALGLHAAAEINYTAWQGWVASTGNSWYAAGQEARRRMTNAGFDVGSGDTWALNELSSAVRANTGSARQNLRDLVHGLYDGDGSQPQTKGIVFVVGPSQNGVSLAQYKANLESWFQDQNFWTDMSSYVSDFFQEVYGDVRNYAIGGTDPASRAALLNAYLQHPAQLVAASGAPGTTAAARNFLATTYGPLANASWGWGSSYGWTQVGSDVMADYISAQTYAMRLSGETHIGFAWNPLNSQGLSSTDYVSQIAGVLARMAGSIHETDGGDPTAACEATGCAATVDGANAANGWSTFSTWTPTSAVFTNPPATLTPDQVSNAFTLQLQTGTAATTLPVPVSLTISSSSPTSTFSTTLDGPWTPTLSMSLPPGSVGAVFYAQDSAGGSPRFTANLNGVITSQVETVAAPNVAPPPPPSISVTTATFTPEQGRLRVALQLKDKNGNPVSARVSFAVLRDQSTFLSTVGQSASDGMIAVTGFPKLQLGCYTAQVRSVVAQGYVWDSASPLSKFCVETLPARVAAVAYGRKNRHLHVGVRIVDDAGKPLRNALVSFTVLHGTAPYASATGRTAGTGFVALTAGRKLVPGCYRTVVSTIRAPHYTWDHVTGSNGYCVKAPPKKKRR
jgi:hypothetical protein